jgi:hypothetical protein
VTPAELVDLVFPLPEGEQEPAGHWDGQYWRPCDLERCDH